MENISKKECVKVLWEAYLKCKSESDTADTIERKIKEDVGGFYESLSKPEQRTFDNAKSRFNLELREIHRIREGAALGKDFINTSF